MDRMRKRINGNERREGKKKEEGEGKRKRGKRERM